MFELRGVSKQYDNFTALHPCDLTVPQETTTVLIGPSGCGKSTMLRLLLGLLHPSTGNVLFDGTTLRPDNVLALRHRMGYVVQDGGLFPHLTAHGNIAFMARFLKWDKERIDQRIKELAELTHLPSEFLHRYPAQLSGGQRQRVGLMRALMLDPTALLMDEPMGALDPLIRFDLQEELREIFRSLKKTVVMVTHDLSEAAFFADQIVLLKEGQIVQKGTIRDLFENPADAFVERFVQAQRGPASLVEEDIS